LTQFAKHIPQRPRNRISKRLTGLDTLADEIGTAAGEIQGIFVEARRVAAPRAACRQNPRYFDAAAARFDADAPRYRARGGVDRAK
jgi:hypothetical protein